MTIAVADVWSVGALRLHPLAEVFPDMDADEYAELVADIKEGGQRQPIWITADNQILDGRHRWRACRELGRDVEAQVYEGSDLAAFVVSLNVKHRTLSKSQKAACALEAEEIMERLEAEAADRRRATQNNKSAGSEVEKIPPQEKAKARDTAAKLFDTNPRYIQDAKRIKEESPEDFKAIKDGTKTISKVNTERQARKREEQHGHATPLPPSDGLTYAGFAISQLERISKKDTKRAAAWAKVRTWLDNNE